MKEMKAIDRVPHNSAPLSPHFFLFCDDVDDKKMTGNHATIQNKIDTRRLPRASYDLVTTSILIRRKTL